MAAFFVWALVAASVVFWSLRLLVRSPPAPSHSVAVASAVNAQTDLTRLLGAAPVAPTAGAAMAPDAASRFKLHGVMAPKGKAADTPSGQGVALISVDGKPPRAFAIGSRLERDLVLQSVSLRTASIGPAQGGASVRLELPALPLPATGKMPLAALQLPAPNPGLPAGNPPVIQGPVVTPALTVPPAPVSRPPHSAAPRRESVNTR